MAHAPPRFVAPTLVEALARLGGDEARGFVFVRSDGTERFCSFAELGREARRRGRGLLERGLTKGDRVALVIPDGDEFVLSFLGALTAGLVPVPIFPQLSFKNVEGYHGTVAHIAQAAGASVLVTTEATRPFVEPVLARADALKSVVLAGDIRTDDTSLQVDVSPADLAFLQFTSGSTSRPKGVAVSHGNLAHNAEAFMVHGLGKDSRVDKGVSWLPLFHDMGLIGFVIGPLFTDIPVVFLPTASFVRAPRLWLETLHKHRGTITYAPNFAYALVSKRLKERDVEGLDLSCVRIAGCGAEPIQRKTLEEFATKLAPAGFDPRAFLPSYGMAEATLAVTFTPRGTGLRADTVDKATLTEGTARPVAPSAPGATALVDCGVAFPDHEVRIVGDDGRALPDRTVGQIATRGPSICQGYFKEPELTAAAFKDGWLYTGDLGYLDGGHLYVCGRIKDMIIVRGRNYYPQDIEWIVGELPGVRRGNVVAFGHVAEDGEEQLVVCAEAHSSEAAALPEAVTTAVAGAFGLSVHAVAVVPQGTLPRTSSGKPQRAKTKQMFASGAFTTGKGVVKGAEHELAPIG